MAITIFVQKLHDPSSEWSLTVNASDTILSVKEKVKELEPIFDVEKMYIYSSGIDYAVPLDNANALSSCGINNNSHLKCFYEDLYVGGKFSFNGVEVSSYLTGVYHLNTESLDHDYPTYRRDTSTLLYFVDYEGLGWILRNIDTGLEEVGSFVMAVPNTNTVFSPILLSASDWDPSLIEGGVTSSDVSIGYYYGFNPIFNKFNYGSEKGLRRFLRLKNSGYV